MFIRYKDKTAKLIAVLVNEKDVIIVLMDHEPLVECEQAELPY